MVEKPIIFLSHSSIDKQLAEEISIQLENELDAEVFVSSRPGSIPSGKPWFDRVVRKLKEASALIILITGSSENSVWVGFELGYFWKKTNGEAIHAIYHPTATIPSPLDILQAKRITSEEETENFLIELCKDFKREYRGIASATQIVKSAEKVVVEPPDRTLAKFERLLERAQWKKDILDSKMTWVCSEDASYQIVVDEESHKEFREEWTLKFPDTERASKSSVQLKIAGIIVEEMLFISVDGGRYFVPIPDIQALGEGKREFFWDRGSLKYKVGQVIAEFYNEWPTFEDFAAHTGIEIR
jgi:hypothetical protein